MLTRDQINVHVFFTLNFSCDTENCNTMDPRTASTTAAPTEATTTPTTTPEGLKCLQCVSMTGMVDTECVNGL